MTDVERASTRLALEAERRHATKLSIIAIGERAGGPRGSADASIVYRLVDPTGSSPSSFIDLEQWNSKAWTSVLAYYNDMNSIAAADIMEGIREALTDDAFGPPEGETLASVDRGK